MKYIVCSQPGQFELKEKNVPDRGRGEALLKIKKVGICGTDLHAYAGNQPFFTYPRILGHELAAEIIEIESNPNGLKKGDKAIVMPYKSCGSCFACRNGKTNCCVNIKVLGVHSDGGMQEVISVPVECLLPAGNLTYNEMAIVEPLAIGAHAIRRAQIDPKEKVLVIGCGPIGIGILKMCKNAGATVMAMDVNQQRLQYVKSAIGVDYIIDATLNPIDQVSLITNDELSPLVFDATGNKLALEHGVDYLAHGGRYVLVGLSNGEISFNHPAIHAKETSILCSRNATIEDFQLVLKILQEKRFPTNAYVTHNVKFSEMIQQFDSWLNPSSGVIKAIVDFDQ